MLFCLCSLYCWPPPQSRRCRPAGPLRPPPAFTSAITSSALQVPACLIWLIPATIPAQHSQAAGPSSVYDFRHSSVASDLFLNSAEQVSNVDKSSSLRDDSGRVQASLIEVLQLLRTV